MTKKTEVGLYKDFDGREIKKSYHNIDVTNYKEVKADDLIKKYSKLDEELHVNELNSGESSFITIVDMEKYGFYILNIKNSDSKIYEGENIFYSFDD